MLHMSHIAKNLKPTIDTQNIKRKEFKHNTKRVIKPWVMRTKEQSENNEKNGKKCIPLNNYFKCNGLNA